MVFTLHTFQYNQLGKVLELTGVVQTFPGQGKPAQFPTVVDHSRVCLTQMLQWRPVVSRGVSLANIPPTQPFNIT